MNIINIEVKNKRAFRTNETSYVCNNSDFTVVFSFDEEWDAFEVKTARFVYGDRHQDVVFTGNECAVPVISDTKLISVGVFAGDIHTTTPALVMANKSILCGDDVPDDPPEDVYNQMVELCNKAVETANSVREDADNGVFDGEKGDEGVSVTHSWKGTVLTVTSASGTSSADLKGEKGDKGNDAIVIDAEVVQTTGDNEDKVMSQKAVTDELGLIAEKIPESVNKYNPATNEDAFIQDSVIKSNGTLMTSTAYFVTPYIKVEPNMLYSMMYTYANAEVNALRFYDENKTVLPATTIQANANKTVYTVTSPENAKWLRLSCAKTKFGTVYSSIETLSNNFNKTFMLVYGTEYPTEYIPFKEAYVKIVGELPDYACIKPLYNKKILNLGDSIFGNDRTDNISQFLAEYSGAIVYNGGLGGTRMTNRKDDNAFVAFDGVNLVTALTTNDWTLQDACIGNVTLSYGAETLQMLKSLDMSTIDIITIAWGTNDWNGGYDHVGGLLTNEKITNALSQIIDMLQSAFPKIRLLVITPIYRMFDEGDSDTVERPGGTTLEVCAKAIEEKAKKKHISVLNSYENMPLSPNTASTYFDSDKTHLNTEGNKLYAHLINGKLNSIY